MRRLFLLLVVCMALLCSCDPASTNELVLVNHSGHNVTITRYWTFQHVQHSKDTEPIKDGDSILLTNGFNVGTTSFSNAVGQIRYEYWADSVTFTFDDGTTRTFVDGVDTVWGPYAFNSDNYAYQQKVNNRMTFHGEILWTRFTLTLRPEDYERCKTK